MSKVVDKVVAFVSSPVVHRVAAALAVAFVGVQGFVAVHGVDFGLDANTVQTVSAVLGGLVVVAHEFVSPVIVPFITALFKPTPPVAK
jgi:hypothetical protein